MKRTAVTFLIGLVAWCCIDGMRALAQTTAGPTNSAPNWYTTIEQFFKMPEGRTWGSTSAVEIDKDGRAIWVAERCGANICLDRATGKMSTLPSILKFDASGKLVASFGAGHADLSARHPCRSRRQRLGDRRPGRCPAASPRARCGGCRSAGVRLPRRPASVRCRERPRPSGLQVQPRRQTAADARQGGRAPRRPTTSINPTMSSSAPTATSSSPRGTAGQTAILKFDRNGKFIKSLGRKGRARTRSISRTRSRWIRVAACSSATAPTTASRSTIRWQASRHVVAVQPAERPVHRSATTCSTSADSESESVARNHDGWKRGIRIGSAKDGKVISFIPDPVEKTTGTRAQPKVSPSMRRATSTAPRSVRGRSRSTSGSHNRGWLRLRALLHVSVDALAALAAVVLGARVPRTAPHPFP